MKGNNLKYTPNEKLRYEAISDLKRQIEKSVFIKVLKDNDVDIQTIHLSCSETYNGQSTSKHTIA